MEYVADPELPDRLDRNDGEHAEYDESVDGSNDVNEGRIDFGSELDREQGIHALFIHRLAKPEIFSYNFFTSLTVGKMSPQYGSPKGGLPEVESATVAGIRNQIPITQSINAKTKVMTCKTIPIPGSPRILSGEVDCGRSFLKRSPTRSSP